MPRRIVPALVVCLYLIPIAVWGEAPAVKKPYFDSNGVKIHYTVQGKEDGEPVLLIHGFSLNIEAQWQPVIKALVNDYRVIALDCRGHGGSEKPHDPNKYGLEMTKDAIRLLDHLKIDKVHLVGYSMGGSIALQIVARYPERVRTATLGGSGLPLSERKKMMKELADSLEAGKGIGPLILALTPQNRPKPTEQQIKAINAVFLAANDSKALAAVVRGLAADKNLDLSEEQVKAIKVPMFGVIGADDPIRKGVDELKKRLPELKVVVIDKADHITAYGREQFVNAIKDFLDAHHTAKK
jgi:pimeloyl-ACP methyl ester carboxylesterase